MSDLIPEPPPVALEPSKSIVEVDGHTPESSLTEKNSMGDLGNEKTSMGDQESDGTATPGSYVLTWSNPPDEGSNPRNWTVKRKYINVLLVSLQALCNAITSTILGVASTAIAEDFGLTDAITPTLPVSLFVLGLGIGPLYLAPLSEIYGRRIVYNISFPIFTLLNIGCALSPNIQCLAVLRFLAGMAGSAAPSLGNATIGDMFTKETRGAAGAIYGFGPTAGPILGGLLGGFIVYGAGWRWCMWIMVIGPGLGSILSFFFLRETADLVLLSQKAKKMTKETGEPWTTKVRVEGKGHIKLALIRPFKLFFLSPICTVCSLYIAVCYGIFYLHLTTIPLLFGSTPRFDLFSYEWPSSITGLAYLGIGSGIISGTIACAKTMNRSFAWMQRRHDKKMEEGGAVGHVANEGRAEFRIPIMQVGMFIVPTGLFIFGWTAQFETNFMGPMVGACIFAFGMIILYICIQMYLVDTYEEYAASALSASVFTRGLVAFILTLIGTDLYTALDYGWGTTLLAFLCVVMIPMPIILYIYGPGLREKGKSLNL